MSIIIRRGERRPSSAYLENFLDLLKEVGQQVPDGQYAEEVYKIAIADLQTRGVMPEQFGRWGRISFSLVMGAIDGYEGLYKQIAGDHKVSGNERKLIWAMAPLPWRIPESADKSEAERLSDQVMEYFAHGGTPPAFTQDPAIDAALLSLLPAPSIEMTKHTLMLRDSPLSEQGLALHLEEGPFYGLTAPDRRGIEDSVLKAARKTLGMSGLMIDLPAERYFTFDDIYGRGHALSLARNAFERQQGDAIDRSEREILMRHLLRNYKSFGEAQTPEDLKTLPSMLHQEVLFRDAALSYLLSTHGAEDIIGLLIDKQSIPSVIDGAEETLSMAGLEDIVAMNGKRKREAMTMTLKSIGELLKAVRAAERIYRPAEDEDHWKLFEEEAGPLLVMYGHYWLGLPKVDTFGAGGARGTESEKQTTSLAPLIAYALGR